MEVYKNSGAQYRKVLLEFPDAVAGPSNSVDVFVHDDAGEMLTEIQQVAVVPTEGFEFTIPLHLVQDDRLLEVRWTVTYSEGDETHSISKSLPVDVVTPILTRREILEVWDNATPVEVTRIEKAVRHVIQAYTGQEFGRWTGTKTLRGDGSNALLLPKRMVSLASVNNQPVDGRYVLDPSGFILRHFPWGVPPLKADYFGLHYHTGGVIHNPNNVRLGDWSKEKTYAIDGVWGWEQIPEPVKEAAKLLVNDYACADAQYRDRYLTSMMAADWRLQFNSGAYMRTGNVRADQLLSDYVVIRGWGVI